MVTVGGGGGDGDERDRHAARSVVLRCRAAANSMFGSTDTQASRTGRQKRHKVTLSLAHTGSSAAGQEGALVRTHSEAVGMTVESTGVL